MFAFVCRIVISDILIYFVLMLRVATVLPVDSHQRLMTSLRIVVYSLDGRWEDDIKIDLQEVGYRGMDWI